MKNQLLIELHKRPQTVFSLKEVSLFMPELPYGNLKRRMAYLASVGAVQRLSQGIYAKENYDPGELANKLYSPSYISLETVLRQAGVTFQYYEQIFSVSYLTRTVIIDNHTLGYRYINKKILLERRGLHTQGNITLATPERAFLDAVYLYREYHFDNLGALAWEQVFELQNLYHSKALARRVKDYYRIHLEEKNE